MSSGDLISDRYASALYELAAETSKVDQVLNDLLSINKGINHNKDLKLLIKSPLITSNDKLKIFEKMLTSTSTNKLTLTFLKVIKNNKRFSNLQNIINEFININAKKRGDVIAKITSANNLTDTQKNEIKEKFKSILGDKLLLNFHVDNKIIGGLIVKIGSKMVDSSIASKLNKLKLSLKEA